MSRDFAWECECGNVEYSEIAPEECEKCFRIDSFTQLPEELLAERSKDSAEEDMEVGMKMAGVKAPKAGKGKKPSKKKSPKGGKRR